MLAGRDGREAGAEAAASALARTSVACRPSRPAAALCDRRRRADAGVAVLRLASVARYLAAPVWLGFIFLLDPINARLGGESLLAIARRAPRSADQSAC